MHVLSDLLALLCSARMVRQLLDRFVSNDLQILERGLACNRVHMVRSCLITTTLVILFPVIHLTQPHLNMATQGYRAFCGVDTARTNCFLLC